MRGYIYNLAPGPSRWENGFDLDLTRWEGSSKQIYSLRSTSFRFATKTDIIHNLFEIMYYIDKWGFVHTTNPNTDEE